MLWFILTIAAVFLVVLETFLEKRTLTKARTFNFAAIFAFANGVVSIPLLLVADFTGITWQVLFLIYITAIFSTITSFLIFKTIKHGAISEVTPILALLPLVVSLLAFFILGERLNAFQIIGLLLMVLGIIFLELKNYKYSKGFFSDRKKKYIVYIIAYLVFGGISVIFDKSILSDFNIKPLGYLAIVQIFIAFNYLAIVCLKPKQFVGLKSDFAKFWPVIILISLLVVAHRFLYMSAIKLAISIGLVVAVFKLSTLFNIFVGKKFFAEKNILKKIIATVIILLGVFILTIS